MFEVKDSGAREEYPSGMRRDTQSGKPDYTLLDYPMLRRWAEHMTAGALKYGRRNWELADSQGELDRFKASAFRHLMQWLSGDRDEDHAAAVYFNIAAAEMVREKMQYDRQTDWFTWRDTFDYNKDKDEEVSSSGSTHFGIVRSSVIGEYVYDTAASGWPDCRND